MINSLGFGLEDTGLGLEPIPVSNQFADGTLQLLLATCK